MEGDQQCYITYIIIGMVEGGGGGGEDRVAPYKSRILWDDFLLLLLALFVWLYVVLAITEY